MRIPFSCPASARFGCFGGAGRGSGEGVTLQFLVPDPITHGRYAIIWENYYSAPDFFVLPGHTLIVPLRRGSCAHYRCLVEPALSYWSRYGTAARRAVRGSALLHTASRTGHKVYVRILLNPLHS